MIGSGAKVLGRLIIGENARIGAASVVLEDIPANATAVGNPARILEPSKVSAATDAKLPS